MRVWAIASCGGLLALAACSAEQSTTPNGAAPPDGDDAAQITARSRATASSPTARSDVRPGQGLQNRVRLSPSVPRPSTTATQPPSSSQLRERVQRLRAQHGSRLSSTALPTTAAPQATSTPLYTSLQAPTPQAAQPLPKGASETSTPDSVPLRLGNASRTVSELQPLTAPPAPPSARSIAPPQNTAPELGPVATANLARSYPIAPLRHQGHSSHFQQQPLVLTAPATPEFVAARVHGGTPDATLQNSPLPSPEAATVLPEPPTVATPNTPSRQQAVAVDEAALSTEIAPIAARAPGTSAHQSSGSEGLTLARQTAVDLTPGDTGTHQSRNPESSRVASGASVPLGDSPTPGTIADRPVSPGGLLESLPLDPADSLSTPRSLGGGLAQGEDIGAPRSQGDPGLARVPMAESATAAIVSSEGSNAPPLGHMGRTASATLRLTPPGENPKNLITGYCLTASGIPLPLAGEVLESTAPLPKFSPSSQADFRLNLDVTPGKGELTAPLCQEASTPASASTLEPVPIPN